MNKNKYEDWQILEYENRLEEAKAIKEIIDYPPKDILLFKYRALKEDYARLMNKKTSFYQGLKEIFTNLKIELLKLASGRIVYFLGEYSDTDHPRYYYFKRFQCPFSPITTDDMLEFTELTKKEFVHSLMNGEGFDEK